MADHNYATSGPKAFYDAKGRHKFCYSKDEEARAKSEGYTSANYVRGQWPKTAYHKKTGESKLIGSLDKTDAENAAALAAVPSDWTFDYVPIPEPPKPKTQEPMDMGALMQILAEMADMRKQIVELQDAAAAGVAARADTPLIEEAPAPLRPPKATKGA